MQKGVYDEVVSGASEIANSIKVAPGTEPDAEMRPLISDEQFGKVLGCLRSGSPAGAEAVVGGDREGDRGYFVQPTLLTKTSPDMSVEREEILGPVVWAIPFDSPEERSSPSPTTRTTAWPRACSRATSRRRAALRRACGRMAAFGPAPQLRARSDTSR